MIDDEAAQPRAGAAAKWTALAVLVAATIALGTFERLGWLRPTHVSFRGDLQRESQFLAQFGQAACTVIVVLLIWLLDPSNRRRILPLVAAVILAAIAATVIKHATGRVRPGFEPAGHFLGPSLHWPASHQSFPSAHTAAAVALAFGLSRLYPRGAPVFWALALICALLRFIYDAHWLSDIVAGVIVGYLCALLAWHFTDKRAAHELSLRS
ncbi:MAG TPA: phosphatase PAP2 family protein [Tepidisphaeraceae bacterium]